MMALLHQLVQVLVLIALVRSPSDALVLNSLQVANSVCSLVL
jgi:hypothetical protein